MASTAEELEADISEALSSGFRGQLLERGRARTMVWDQGILPANAPEFSQDLTYDLLSYGYSLIGLAIRLKELQGNSEIYRAALSNAAYAIQHVVVNGDSTDTAHCFHKILAGAAYHLSGYSAKAYSLIQGLLADNNSSVVERALCNLILRNLSDLEHDILSWKLTGAGSDEAIARHIDEAIDDLEIDEDIDMSSERNSVEGIEMVAVREALDDNYLSAVSLFLTALDRGEIEHLEQAQRKLTSCLEVASDFNMVPQWWVFRLTRHLFDELWKSSFHTILPENPPHLIQQDWLALRWNFICLLSRREKAEIELWPSQIEGATRSADQSDDLVVSLPTSAGKTRIAELCILRCLAEGKRVLFITPLRALSAQTEFGLRKTFAPLGKTVSALYGSIGTSNFEQDALRSRDIVVGTPEKLDFALRSDPALLDDVGLVVLDEGHMIGLSEREIRYEVQIQRLLKREDANSRRIVCLSAILPDGEQMEDFVSWLRRDADGSAVKSNWRPTELEFGEVVWNGESGKLNLYLEGDDAFVPRFLEPVVPGLPNPGTRTTPFPKNQQELTIATAWRLVEDQHTVLIYCPEKRSVHAMATTILDIHRRGGIESVLQAPEQYLRLAKALGAEWLGEEHPILECLNIGVAIHHGSLPTPYRKEVEKLLRDGVLKITVSSPTLAQGLNLSATALIIHSLHRYGDIVEASEFKNVIGRAGRAYVDLQGLVIHPIFTNHANVRNNWKDLIHNADTKNMESGLYRLVYSLVIRMADMLGQRSPEVVLEYVLNNANAWNFPVIARENLDTSEAESTKWSSYITNLDVAILSFLGEQECTEDEIADLLDEVLSSSLWQRRVTREQESIRNLLNVTLNQRAKYIWKNSTSIQRKGYFLAGVGLETGRQLDAISAQANVLLVNANYYISQSAHQEAIKTIIQLAEMLLAIEPFKPKNILDDWRNLISTWLSGLPVGTDDIEVLEFVEDVFVYRLPWGMEAIRVRAEANNEVIADDLTIDDYETGLVVPAMENGTMNHQAMILMQAGFNSRLSAILAVTESAATFSNLYSLKHWLKSEYVTNRVLEGDWPTPETAELWKDFVHSYEPDSDTVWGQSLIVFSANWSRPEQAPKAGEKLRLVNSDDGQTLVLTAESEILGNLDPAVELDRRGIYFAIVSGDRLGVDVTYMGPSKSPFELLSPPPDAVSALA